MRFEAFTVKNHVKVCWVVMPCGVAVGYQCFGGPCCLKPHPEDEGNMDL